MTIILIILAIIVIWAIVAYNGLVRSRNRAQESWADIDVQLKRRYDLIPNLVNTVKGYAAHESGAFEKVTQARAAAMGATGLSAKGVAENQLAGALKSVFAIAEAYPDLKANQNFLSLQSELTDTEDKIQAARRFYNGNVRDFNTSIQVFPGSIMAGMFHFKVMEFFQLDASDAAAKQPVEVKF
jgi:LemA protein